MKTRVTILAENDKSLSDKYTKEHYERIVKVGWEMLLEMMILNSEDTNRDKFTIESVEVEE